MVRVRALQVRWGRGQRGVHVVSVDWLAACGYAWRCVDERESPVTPDTAAAAAGKAGAQREAAGGGSSATLPPPQMMAQGPR